MRVHTLTELMRLCGSSFAICWHGSRLRNFPVGSVEQNNAIINLRNTTRILMQRDLCLG
jgi:hypothetical protein